MWIGVRKMRIEVVVAVLVALSSLGFGDGAPGCPLHAAFGRRALKQVVQQPALQFGYYSLTCPTVAEIVTERVNYWVLQDIRTPGKLLRLFFHDCMAAGCEASILLNSTAEVQAEKDAPISSTLDKFAVIDDIKAAVELACPGVVSCADILALAAVKSVALAGGPAFDIDLGRRDGFVSYYAAAPAAAPTSIMKVPVLLTTLAMAGLDINDLVALSGAHTIGEVHCTNFVDRFDPNALSPFPDAAFGAELQAYCTGNGANPDFATLNLKTFLDLQSPNMFDTSYFVNLIIGRGVITSDQDLFNDASTQPMVRYFATNRTAFFEAFVASTLKMGRQGVLTGTNGIIRKQCWTSQL